MWIPIIMIITFTMAYQSSGEGKTAQELDEQLREVAREPIRDRR